MADIQDLDEFVELASVGENVPPVAVGARGTAHITGPAPTGAWSGCPNALAVASGDGSYAFTDAAGMKKHLYFWGGVLNAWDGTALAPIAAGGEPAAPELPADPAVDGVYALQVTVAAGVATKTWEPVVPPAGDAARSGADSIRSSREAAERADREKRAAGGGPDRPPSSSTGPKGPSGGAGGGRLA